MKIEKRKVSSAIAATLGITASFALSACDNSSSPTSDQVVEPTPDSVNSPETISSSSQTEGPASSSQAEANPTASSSSINIPMSQEPVSSSLMEAISSALESSSSAAEPASSDAIEPTEEDIKNACQGWSGGATSVTIGGQVYLCPDSSGEMVMFSMVSTYERTDTEV